MMAEVELDEVATSQAENELYKEVAAEARSLGRLVSARRRSRAIRRRRIWPLDGRPLVTF